MAAVAAALGLAAMVVAAAVLFEWDAGAIAVWVAGRDRRAEPLPFSMFVLPLGVPALAAAAALAVAVRRAM